MLSSKDCASVSLSEASNDASSGSLAVLAAGLECILVGFERSPRFQAPTQARCSRRNITWPTKTGLPFILICFRNSPQLVVTTSASQRPQGSRRFQQPDAHCSLILHASRHVLHRALITSSFIILAKRPMPKVQVLLHRCDNRELTTDNKY